MSLTGELEGNLRWLYSDRPRNVMIRKLDSTAAVFRLSNGCSGLRLLVTRLHRIASVDGNRLAVQVLTHGNEHDRLSHVGILARTLGRKTLLLLLGHLRLLVIVAALLSSHLAREDTWGDAVDADLDTVLCDLSCEHLVDVDCGALAGVVREVVLRDADVARDRRDVDDCGGPATCLLGALREEREEGSAHEERTDNIGLVGVEPLLLACLAERVL